MEDITIEELKMRIRRAAQCASVTLLAEQLIPLFSLALRDVGIYNSETIKQLQEISGEAELTLTGDEFRLILDLALRAKRSENKPRRPRLRAVSLLPRKK